MQFLNNKNITILEQLIEYFKTAYNVYIGVAFIRNSGVKLLDNSIRNFIKRGGLLKIIVGKDFGYTQPEALTYLEHLGVEIKVFIGNEIFHPKCYLFENQDIKRAIIGSSNLTSSGLESGVEWNIAIEETDNKLSQIFDSFEQLWHSNQVNDLSEKILNELRENVNQRTEENFQKKIINKLDRDSSEKVIQFDFKTNETFLNHSSHQLTILKKYNTILSEYIKRNHFDAKLSFENKIVNSYIYRGTAGWGLAYIIRTTNDNFRKISNFNMNETLKVTLKLRQNSCDIILEKYY